MNPTLTHGAVLALGLLLGAGLGRALGPGDTAPATPPATPAPATVAAPASQPARAIPSPTRAPATAPASLEACQDALAASETRIGVLENQLVLYGGARAEWPADVDPVFRQPALQALIDEVLPELDGGALLELDCDEFPCIAVLEFEGADASSANLFPLSDALREQTDNAMLMTSIASTEHGMVGILPLSPQLEDPDTRTRLETRMREKVQAQ